MTLTAWIALLVFAVCIVAAAVLLANGIADEPPATAAAALLAFVIAPGLAYQWRTRRRGRP